MRWLAVILTASLLLPRAGAQKAVSENLFRDLQRASEDIELGDLEHAQWLLESLVADAPDYAGAWFQLALCRNLRDDAAGAAKAVERAMSLDPDNLQAVVLAVEVFAKVDRVRAVSLAQRVAESSDDPRMLQRVLDVLVGLRETEVALPILDEVLAANPRDLKLLETKARWALEAKKPDQAISAYQAMLKVKPVNPPVLQSLAQVQLHLGRTGEAMKTFERTLKVNPSNIAVRDQLVRLLVETGGDAEEIALHRRYLDYYRYWQKKRAEKGGQVRSGK